MFYTADLCPQRSIEFHKFGAASSPSLFSSISNVQNPTNPPNPTLTKKGPVVCSAAVIPTNLQNPTNPTNPTQKTICRIVQQLASPLARGHAADRGLPPGPFRSPLRS